MTVEGRTYLPDEASREATGRRMRATRQALGLSQTEMAKAIGANRQTYNNYDAGVSRPNVLDAIRYVRRYGLSLDWIYLGDMSGLRHDLAEKIRLELKQIP